MKCEACAALDREVTERIERKRMMEDLAAAFAVLGIFAWLDAIGYSQHEMTWALHRLCLYSGDDRLKLNGFQRNRYEETTRIENATLREMMGNVDAARLKAEMRLAALERPLSEEEAKRLFVFAFDITEEPSEKELLSICDTVKRFLELRS